MAVKRISSDIDVVTAARQRIKNVFSNGVPVYLSFSGGKDSIVLADLTYKLIQAGEINPSQLTVLFVDEEAIFDSIEATTKAWRKKFLLAGAKFQWWCIEVKHFSCLNELSSDETFVCWDRRKRDVWVRQPPPFAIRNHPQLRPRIDNYQSFLPRVTMDGIMITGVRAAESIQRLQYMAALNMGAKGITGTNTIYPIYDWKTADVWLYLRDQRIEVPEVYLQMYQVGVNRNQLRVSQFFSVDTVPVLVAKAFGRAINSEVLEKVGKLESELQCVRSGMAEEKAVNCRARILRFGDECLHGERHTKDHFDQTLRDIAAYERYCEDHPEFENNVTELTSDRIKTIYRRCLDSNDFLQ